jgi:hypothetical protein
VADGGSGTRARVVDAACPLRPGQPCTLCHPEAFLGPQDCPTVAIVMDDPELRAEAARLRRAHLAATGATTPATAAV